MLKTSCDACCYTLLSAKNCPKVRQFNKRFYEEFRREAQKQDKSKATSTRSSGPSPGASKHQVMQALRRIGALGSRVTLGGPVIALSIAQYVYTENDVARA